MANYAYDPVALIRNWQEQHSNYLANTDPDVLKSRQMYGQNHVYDLGNGYFGAGSDPNGPINIARNGFQVGDKYQLWSPDGNGGYTAQDKTKVARTGWMKKLGDVFQAVTPAVVSSMTMGAAGFGPFSPEGAFSGAYSGADAGSAWTSGYDVAGGSALPTGGGGLFGTGFSTGSTFGDWLAKQGAGMGLRAGIGSLIGGNSPTRTGTNGGTGMADDFWGGLLGTGLTAGVLNNSGQRVSDAYNTSANNIMTLANSLKDTGKFTPYNISTGLGSVTAGPDGSMQAALDPKYQANSDLALSQSNYWLNKRANPLYEANEQKGLFGAGQLMDKASAFDPEANAKIEYDLMQKIFAPTRENENLDMENRLLQQGRLGLNYGSYGAAPELMALKEAQRRQDLQATKDSRQLAFERQNNLISQADAMQGIGIKAGQAGTAQQKAYYDMANGLQQMSLRPQEMLAQQMGQSITAGANRSNAEQANARLFGNMGLEAEKQRSAGAFADAGFKNARDNAILQAISGKGGAGGLLAGAGGAASQVAGLAQKLLGMGIPQESLAQVMSDMGVDIDQGMNYEDFGNLFDDLKFSDAADTWSGAGDMDMDWLSW